MTQETTAGLAPGAALITGAGRRLGAAMARSLGEMGWDVALHCMSSRAGADEAAAAVEAAGRRAAVLPADLLDAAQVDALVPRAAEALGRPLTLLINNASIFEPDAIGSVTAESWERHLGSNLRAPLFLTQAFAAQAPAAGTDPEGWPVARALVVNMADQRVWKPTPAFMTYSLAKHGLWALTRSAAQALAPAIRVNAIGPGPTLRGDRQTQEHFDAQRRGTILQRGGSPAEICAALRYLISADAVTGQMIAVDAGQHLGWRTPDVIGRE